MKLIKWQGRQLEPSHRVNPHTNTKWLSLLLETGVRISLTAARTPVFASRPLSALALCTARQFTGVHCTDLVGVTPCGKKADIHGEQMQTDVVMMP